MIVFPGINSQRQDFVYTEQEINIEKNKILKSITTHIGSLVTDLKNYIFLHHQFSLNDEKLNDEMNVNVKQIIFCTKIVDLYIKELLTFDSEWILETEENIFNYQNLLLIFCENIKEFSNINTSLVEDYVITNKRIKKDKDFSIVEKDIINILRNSGIDDTIETHITSNGPWYIYSTDIKIHGLQRYIYNLSIGKKEYPEYIGPVSITLRQHQDFRILSWMNDVYKKNLTDIANDLFDRDVKNLIVAVEDKSICFHEYETLAKRILYSNTTRLYKKYFYG